MSLLRRIARRAQPRGAVLLSRPLRDQGALNWPKCAKCMRAVDAYGIEADNILFIEIWARCDGVRIDPRSGQQVYGAPRVHESEKSSVKIMKGLDFSRNRLTDIISRLAFFAPDAASEGREFTQNITPEGVRKKWTV